MTSARPETAVQLTTLLILRCEPRRCVSIVRRRASKDARATGRLGLTGHPLDPPPVMPALVAGIHDFPSDGGGQVVDTRAKPGHDGRGTAAGNAPSNDPSPLVGEGARVSGRVRG
jgi:hypothetical protein